MKRIYFITGTDTGVGKTVLTALLAQFLRGRGLRVAALKPVCSGGRADARALHAALGGALRLNEINPWHFRAAIAPVLSARRERQAVKLAAVLAHIRAVRERYDVMLVEGAGGLLSPLGEDFDSRDLVSALGAKPMIVAPNKLGVVNHVLLTVEALPKTVRAGANVVWMSPRRRDAAAMTNAALLEEWSGQKSWHVPWLGGDFSIGKVLRRAAVKRTLAALVGI